MKGEFTNYNYENSQKRFDSMNNSNNLIKDEISIRPISASIKRPEIFKFNKTGLKVQKTEFPTLMNHISQISQQSETQKAKSISKNVEKERLYDDNINLKALISNLKKENSYLRSQGEMERKDKAIEDMNTDMQSNNLNRGNMDYSYSGKGGKETSLIMNLRKQIKEVDKEIKQKNAEYEQIKKNLRITKMNELSVEISTMNEEIVKLRRFLEISVRTNFEKEKYLNDYLLLKDVFMKQQNQLITLDDKSAKLDQELKAKEDELEVLKVAIKEKDMKIIKLTKEFKESLETSEKLDKEIMLNDHSALTNKLSTLESKLANIKKEIAFFKSEADKKEKKYKDLEKIAKGKIDFNANSQNSNFKESIKFSARANYQDSGSYVSGDELKARFQVLAKEKEELEIQNKKLTEKLNFHENKQDSKAIYLLSVSNHMNSNQNNINNAQINTNELAASNNNVAGLDENNLNNQNENQDNEGLDEEELKSYLYSEDQFKEFTYILIKNFEAQKLDSKKLTRIFNEVDQNTDEIILSDLATKIADCLGIKNNIDQTKILIYINTLLIYSGSDYDSFKMKFFSLFDNISSFTESQQESYRKELVIKLKPYAEQLNEAISSYDQQNTGFITFQQLRKILDSIEISLEDELVEYLIFLMKTFKNNENTNLEDLKYANIVSLIPKGKSGNTEEVPSNRVVNTDGGKAGKSNKIPLFEENTEDFKADKAEFQPENVEEKVEKIEQNNEQNVEKIAENNEVGLKQEDSEVVITTNQFNKIIEGIFMKIAEHLLTNKQTARSLFKEIIYSHELNNEVYEAIPLQYLLDDLEKINIKIDTIGIHCLYEKLKYSDDFESIDVGKLVEELENYGIFENSISNNNQSARSKRENPDEFYSGFASFLNEKNLSVKEFLKSVIGVSEGGEMLVKLKDLEEVLNDNNLWKNKSVTKTLLKEIMSGEEYISVEKLTQKLGLKTKTEPEINQEKNETPQEKEKLEENPIVEDNVNAEEKLKLPLESKGSKKSEKENKKEIDLDNDIPEADSKLFNETLNGLKEKGEEEQKKEEDNSLLALEKELEEEEKKKDTEVHEKKE